MSESEMQERIDEITRRYKPRLDALQEKGQALADDVEKPSTPGAMIGSDVEIDWKEVEFIFDLPVVTVKNRTMALDVPEMTFTRHKISFNVPEIRMVAKKIGQYPVFHGPKVKWKDIITHVPETVMVRRDIVTDLPRVVMNRKEITVPVPEFSTKRQRWVTKLPQFKLVNVRVETEAVRKKGEALQAESEQISAEMTAEFDAVVASFMSGVQARGFDTRTEIVKSFDNAVTHIQSAITSLQTQGCDPIKVPTEGGDVNLRKLLTDVIERKEQAVSELDRAVEASEALAVA